MPPCHLLSSGELTPALRRAVRRLLDAAFDGDFSDQDWEHALGGWHAVVVEGDRPVAHAAVVPRPLEVAATPFAAGYVEAVAAVPECQGRGLGSRAMRELMPRLRATFALGALSTGHHHFYERLGWERWQGPAFVRHGEDRVRTPEEDAGVMVLRFGPSRDLDRTAPITCPARPGDDW